MKAFIIAKGTTVQVTTPKGRDVIYVTQKENIFFLEEMDHDPLRGWGHYSFKRSGFELRALPHDVKVR